MNYRKVLVVLIAVGIVIGVFLLTRPNPTIQKPLKIGATLALTGNLAYIGESEKNGLTMAVEEINSNNGINGRKIDLIIDDNQGDVGTAATSVNKLLTVDNVDILFSAFTHITNSIKDIVGGNNKVMIYASAVNDIAKSSPLFFKDYFDIEQHGKFIARVVAQDGHRQVKFFTEVNDACQQYENAFREEGKKYGVEIIQRESYQSTEQDFKTQLNKFKTKMFDALVTCTFRHEHVLMKQFKELGMINIPTYHLTALTLPVADTPEMRQLFSENRSVTTWFGFLPNTSEKKQKEFIEKYKAKYGSEPRSDSAYAYDDVYAIASALTICEKANNIASPCISKELQKTNLDGVGGTLSFNENRASKRPVVLLRAENNEWKEIPLPE